jgi:hypothetical protein
MFLRAVYRLPAETKKTTHEMRFVLLFGFTKGTFEAPVSNSR